MNTVHKNKPVIAKTDYEILKGFLERDRNLKTDKDNQLSEKVEKAEIIDDEAFPWEIVRLNSKVIIRDKLARVNYTYILVLPQHADHRKCKVSVLSTIGSSLIGSRRGDDIFWNTPKGRRYFTVMAVSQYEFY